MSLGGENSTSTLNLVGSSLGVAQSAPLEMAPLAGTGMEMSCLHTESEPTTSQSQAKAGHLLHCGNPRQVAATQITSTSLSIKTGAPPSLFLLCNTTYCNTSTCWEPTQQSHQAHAHMRLRPTMRQLTKSWRLEETRSRPHQIGNSQIWWMTMTFHHSPWPHDRTQHRLKSLVT